MASRSSSRRRGSQHSYWDREQEQRAEEGYGPGVHTIFWVERGRGHSYESMYCYYTWG